MTRSVHVHDGRDVQQRLRRTELVSDDHGTDEERQRSKLFAWAALAPPRNNCHRFGF